MSSTIRPSTLTGTYAIDPVHSSLGFIVRQAIAGKVRGSFTEFAGMGYFDAGDPTQSHLELTIQAESIDTRNVRRDAHLRSNAYFGVAEHPEITFVSTAVERIDDSKHRVTGDLTIKGVTKPVSVDFELTHAADDSSGDHRIGFEGKAVVSRKDWGVKWNALLEGAGLFVGEKVTLQLEVSAIRTANDT